MQILHRIRKNFFCTEQSRQRIKKEHKENRARKAAESESSPSPTPSQKIQNQMDVFLELTKDDTLEKDIIPPSPRKRSKVENGTGN